METSFERFRSLCWVESFERIAIAYSRRFPQQTSVYLVKSERVTTEHGILRCDRTSSVYRMKRNTGWNHASSSIVKLGSMSSNLCPTERRVQVHPQGLVMKTYPVICLNYLYCYSATFLYFSQYGYLGLRAGQSIRLKQKYALCCW